MKLTTLFATPVMQIDLPQNPEALNRIAEAAKKFHYARALRDAEFIKRTGRHVISRADFLHTLSKEDRDFLVDPITSAVKEFVRVGLGDPIGHERKLAVRGFVRAYEPGGRVAPHTHFDADVVVSFYAVAGETSEQRAGDLVLIDPVNRGFPHRSPCVNVPVHQGLAVIFPAYLLHESEPTPAERVVTGLEYRVINHDMEKIFTPLEN